MYMYYGYAYYYYYYYYYCYCYCCCCCCFYYLPTLSNPLSGSDLFIKLAFFFKSEQDGDFHSLSSPRAYD